jgi:hypothetical protein
MLRGSALLSILAIGAGAVELHAPHGFAAAHDSLRPTRIAATPEQCAPGQRAHFDSATVRVERPCDACLRTAERVAVGAAAIGASASPRAETHRPALPAPSPRSAPRPERPVRGPPVA